MSGVSAAFAKEDHKALICYLTAGYPSIEATLEAVPVLASSGCDLVEIGIPFSDPLADGATIQRASFRALQNGVTPEVCLDIVRKVRKQTKIPIVFMSYYNPVLSQGLESFCQACARVGVNGLIIPDLPPEEGSELEAACDKHSLDLIYLLAPTSTPERIALVAAKSRGFIYIVSLTGVTGARARLSDDLESFVLKVQKIARQPLCVGFGISTPEQAARVAKVADGVIIGSRLVQLLEEKDPLPRVQAFVRGVREALDSAKK